MINIGGGPAFILGVAMVLAGVALYALRSMRPELSRDHDIFFAAIALTTGAILMWQGWRLDPFLFLGYLCAAGSATFFGIENIRLRGITTEQAKRSTPITDKGRAVSRRYDYEPQDMDYDPDYDYRPERRLPSREDRDGRRIRATREPRQRYPEEGRRLRRSDDYPDDYQDDYGDRYEGDRYGDAPYRDNRYAQVGAEPPLEAPPRKRRLPRSRRPEPAVRSVPVQDDWDAPDMPTESIGPSSLPPID
ncbi:MAG: Ycf66 family protein, partial [Cyanobacteria bacterium P01_A01_bin.135]